MKVLHVAEALDPRDGGSSEAIPRMALALANVSHDVTVAYRVTGRRRRSALMDGLPAREVCLEGRWPSKDVDRLVSEHEVVHVHGMWERLPWLARRSALRRRVPFVFSTHGALSLWALANGRTKKRAAMALLERRLLRKTPRFIVTSVHEREELLEEVCEARVEVIPHGIDAPRPQGVPKERSIVGFLGRLHPVKGLAPLVEAFTRISESAPGLTLELAGPVAAGYERWIETVVAGSGGRVRMIGALDGFAKWEFLERCTVVALPSYFENFGLAAGEALAMGTPVVVGRATAWGDVERLGFGAVVEPDAASIERGLRLVLGNAEIERAACTRAPDWIRENYSWAYVASALERVYASVRDEERSTR